jgi:fumarate reductase flavoprotein subunit
MSKKLVSTTLVAALALAFCGFAGAEEITHEADVVIVGGGPAGMVAAAFAAENGVKPILVEKLPGVGGNLMMLEITFGQQTEFTDADLVYYPKEEIISDFLKYSHYMVNPVTVKRFVERSGQNIKWLTNRGVEIIANTPTELNGRRVGHIYKNVFPHRNFIEAMRKIILDNGGKIIVETRADKLLLDKSGRVIGVHAKDYKNDDIILKAKGGVILTAGGYGANPKLLKLLNPEMPADTPITGIKTSTGDGIQMGIDIGAKTAGGDAFISEGALPYKVDYREVIAQKTWIAANVLNKGPSLQLNKNGKRFFNEGLGGDFSVSGNAMKINGNYMYTLIDEAEKQDLESGKGAVFGYFGHAHPGDKMVGLTNLFSGKGRMAKVGFVGNTIEEVAEKAGLDPKVVRETVDRYNKFCDEGVDDDFGKDRRYLRPVKKAPFYIAKGQHTICDTAGGLLVNEDAQVIAENGDPIPGLYASGAMAGGKYGPSYVYNVATGYASGSAMMGGTFAVQHLAKKYLGKDIVYTPDLPKHK